MNRAERVIWAGGFFDGEAFIGLSRGISKSTQRPFHQPLIDVAQTKREVLDVLVELFGGKVRLGKNWHSHIHFWRITGADTFRVLPEVLPYLIGKRRQAELILEYQRISGRQGRWITDEILAKREAIHAELKVLNHRRSPAQAERLSEEAPQEASVPQRVVR
jgi:hypothetical protein